MFESPPASPETGQSATPESQSKRTLILRGVAWNSIYHVFSIPAGFVSMLVLARVLSPAQYGQVAAVSGWISLFNAIGCQGFLAHALQLSDQEEPNWQLHWSACLWIQLPLFLTANVLAGSMWFVSSYRTIAPLLHLASFALLLSLPHLLSAKMLERKFDFRRLQMFSVIAVILSTTVTLSLARWFGAYSVIFGGSICNLLPFSFYLFSGLRWRPIPGWWRWPNWNKYRPALAFGVQQNLGSLLQGARGIAEAAVLPGTIGFGPMGLINRAQGLFQGTAGRLSMLIMDSAYPVLPRLASNPAEYPRQATAFLQTALLGLIPAGCFLALEGPHLSRLLYGSKWIEADPLLLPGTLAGMFAIVLLLAKNILLAANRLRACYMVNVVTACFAAIPVMATKLGCGALTYIWLVVVSQCIAFAVAMFLVRSLLTRSAVSGFVAPVCAAALGAIAVLFARELPWHLSTTAALTFALLLYTLIVIAALRFGFPRALMYTLRYLPGGDTIRRLLRLN